MAWAYYNEIDPHAAQWLRNLIAAGHITGGYVDERNILDIAPDDLRGFQRHHFFAGIGVWDFALRQAGWPDERPVATGSCPCQPFSATGKGGGFDDERHLWPAFFYLIRECGFSDVFGEQVAGSAGMAWLALVQSDMEAEGYTFGAANLCAAGVGAPHVRERIWFVAHAEGERLERRGVPKWKLQKKSHRLFSSRSNYNAGSWSNPDWIKCRDGVKRPVEPFTLPVAYGAPSAMVRLRGYGNAINERVAREFISAFLEVCP